METTDQSVSIAPVTTGIKEYLLYQIIAQYSFFAITFFTKKGTQNYGTGQKWKTTSKRNHVATQERTLYGTLSV